MKLNKLPRHKNYKRKAKIIGRGTSNGKGGHTVGRGMNGQTSRSGGNQLPRLDFEGGQNPLSRRLPKYRGFKRGFDTKKVIVVKLSQLKKYPEKDIVNSPNLLKHGLLKKNNPNSTIKFVGEAKEYKGKHTFEGVLFTKSAKLAVEKAGAKIK